jgi:hypothetical protein
MTVLDDLADECPLEVRAQLNEYVEVAPGVMRRFGDCTQDDVAGSVEASHEAAMNHREIVDLLQRALSEKIVVPADLQERLRAGGHGPRLVALRNELRSLIAPGRA